MADTIKTVRNLGVVIQGSELSLPDKYTVTYELPNPVDNLDETTIRNNTAWMVEVAKYDKKFTKKFSILAEVMISGAYVETKNTVDLDLTGV